MEFITIRPVQQGDALLCCQTSAGRGLLVQFDGSCLSSQRAGGAGAAFFEIQSHGLALIRWSAIALPN